MYTKRTAFALCVIYKKFNNSVICDAAYGSDLEINFTDNLIWFHINYI